MSAIEKLVKFLINELNILYVPLVTGCRASAMNLEAKSLYTWSTSRHCVMARYYI